MSMIEDLAKETDDAKYMAAQLQDGAKGLRVLEGSINKLQGKLQEDAEKLWDFVGGERGSLPSGTIGAGNIYDEARKQGLSVPITRSSSELEFPTDDEPVSKDEGGPSKKKGADDVVLASSKGDKGLAGLTSGKYGAVSTDTLLKAIQDELMLMKQDMANMANKMNKLSSKYSTDFSFCLTKLLTKILKNNGFVKLSILNAVALCNLL